MEEAAGLGKDSEVPVAMVFWKQRIWDEALEHNVQRSSGGESTEDLEDYFQKQV